MPSRPTTHKTSSRAKAAAPSKAPVRGAAVKPAAKPAGHAATAKSATRVAAKPAPKSPAKATPKPPAKAPARSKSAVTKAATKAAAKPPTKAAKAPAKVAAKSPARAVAKTPAKVPAPKNPPRVPASPVAPAAVHDDVRILRDAAGTLGGATPDEVVETSGVELPTAEAVAPPVDAEPAGTATIDPTAEEVTEEVEVPSEPSTPEPEPVPEDLSPEEWFRREKARRTRPATADVMAEARALLLQAVAEAGPRRGRPVRVGAAAKGKPTKKLAPDEFELEEYRPGEKKAPGET